MILNNPSGLTFDSNNNLYIADFGNNRIVCYKDGDGFDTVIDKNQKFNFNNPRDLTVDEFDNIIIADEYNHKIKKIDTNGNISTLAGSIEGDCDGIGNNVQFRFPIGIDCDKKGSIYISDFFNHKIKKMTYNGSVSTFIDIADGFYKPAGLSCVDDGLIVCDYGNSLVKIVDFENGINNIDGDFSFPIGVCYFDAHLYICDYGNQLVKQINIKTKKCKIATIYTIDGDKYTRDIAPYGVAVNSVGNIFITDIKSNQLYRALV